MTPFECLWNFKQIEKKLKNHNFSKKFVKNTISKQTCEMLENSFFIRRANDKENTNEQTKQLYHPFSHFSSLLKFYIKSVKKSIHEDLHREI